MQNAGVRIIGVLTALVLGAGVGTSPSAQGEVNRPGVQRASDVKVTARATVPTRSVKELAPSADGRFLVAVQGKRLVRYRIRPSKIRKVGQSRSVGRLARVEGLEVHPNGKYAYAAVTPRKDSTKKFALLVFRVDRPKVKLVKAIGMQGAYPDKRVVTNGLAMRPDGKQVYLTVRRDLVTFAMGGGKKGKLLSVERGQSVSWRPGLTVTPDGTKLITGVRGQERARLLRYRVWDLTPAGPVPGEERQIDISDYGYEDGVSLFKVVPAPDNKTAHVEALCFVDYADYQVMRVRISDGKVLSTLGDPFAPVTVNQLLGRSPSGKRLYIADRGRPRDDKERERVLGRTDPGLASYTKLKPTRLALEDAFAVSSAGRTKGLIYTVQKRKGHDHLVSVRN